MPATLGQLVRSARNAVALTQPAAAAVAGVSVGTWSRTERDKLVPEPRYLAAMSHAVSITPEQLESCGKHEAAVLLRARIEQADGKHHMAPASISTAIVNFQMAAVDIGWSFLLRHPDQDTYLIELRRDGQATAAG